MKFRYIQIHVQPLSALLLQSPADFSDLSAFNHFKKQCVHQHRQHKLSHYLKLEITAQNFAHSEYGKPYLVSHPHLAFNHSHSQQHYALAMSQSVQDLGVDIEDLNRKVRFDALAQHAFHPDEYHHWKACDEDPNYWFKVWTSKEAILKASGLGIRMSLKQLNTQCHPVHDGGICQHPQVGIFAYQNLHLPHAMLTVAWRTELSCGGLDWPRVELL